MLSEGYDPGWRAEVDGEPAPVLVADHVLRAVPLPAGKHAVELRYVPPGLRLGLAITGITAAGLIGALGVEGGRRLRARAVGRTAPGAIATDWTASGPPR